MSRILVTPLSAVEETIHRDRPSHLVTLLSPEHMIDTPAGIEAERHLRLAVNDVAETRDSEAPPAEAHIEKLLAFGRAWTADAPILVHCWAGISRSTAAAYILLCDRHGSGTETEIAKALRYRAPHACPNPLMIRLADAMLERDGRMIDAIEGIGRGSIVALGERVELPIALAEL
jgi:predicted protein tyrosine phosphatase